MASRNIVFRGELQSAEGNPSNACRLYPKLDYAQQSWIGVDLDLEGRNLTEFYLAEGQRLAHIGSWHSTLLDLITGLPNYFRSTVLMRAAVPLRKKSIWPSYTQKIAGS